MLVRHGLVDVRIHEGLQDWVILYSELGILAEFYPANNFCDAQRSLSD